IYHDPLLDSLQQGVIVNNQTIKQFVAQYAAAVALTHEAQAGLFPTLGLNAGVTRSAFGSSRGSSSIPNAGGSSIGGGGSGAFTQYTVEGTADWTPDLWGRIRREVQSEAAAAQVSAADLANAALSAEATLAADYFDLRATDALTTLLQQTVVAFREALHITENQYNAGTISRADVVTAQAQLQTVIAQLAGTGVQRAEFEHAIAVLTGRPPAALTIPPGVLAAAVPVVPPGLPSTLLERRPDIAAAERAMQEENALIGVAVAAYYPDISLSALGGFVANPLGQLFTVSNRVWSLGAAASETLFEGGLRPAAVQAARANYDAAVASYRQTVLTAFQQVEDELAALRILKHQAAAEATAVTAAQQALDVTLNEYTAGTVAYTSVITQQELLLTDQQTALSIQQSRLLASVALVQALGGGWNTAQLPTTVAVEHFNPLRP
ncbi:MAG TPA: efflux transporter outer membrane subunit, partial [Acetobacteraceae bacterium]|nr:efflux transporter outer membrane subunit [Acetobacteraceae bacterium]